METSTKSMHHARAQPAPSSKLSYASNLRSSLTALVILHHAATTYGGVGRNVYQSTLHPQASSAALVGFNAINQSFFMGSFMYLGGYFSRRALERKGRSAFIKDRLIRLGLPTIAYTILAAPFCFAVVRRFEGQTVNMRYFVNYWKDMRGVRGPLWFTATLLTFDVTLAGFDWIRQKLSLARPSRLRESSAVTSQHVSSAGLCAAIAITSMADFCLRLVCPVNTMFRPLKLNVGYLPQYIATYAFGTYVSHLDFAIPSSTAFFGLAFASATSSYSLLRAFRYDPQALSKLWGGPQQIAGLYSIWNNAVGYLLGSALLDLFSKHVTTDWRAVNNLAYSAFIVHMPVLTVLGCMTDRWQASGINKTIAIGSATVIGSWGIAWLGDKLTSGLARLWRRSGTNIQ